MTRALVPSMAVAGAAALLLGAPLPAPRIALAASATQAKPKSVAPPAIAGYDSATMARFAGDYRLDSGAIVRIGAAAHGLSIEPRGQAAFDLLATPDSAASALNAVLNQRASVLIVTTRDRDYAYLDSAIPEKDAELYKTNIDEGWQSLTKRYGRFERYEVLGTAPHPTEPRRVRTYASIALEKGSVPITFDYEGGALTGVKAWDGPSTSIVPLVPLSATEFTTGSPSTKTGARVSFVSGADSLVVRTSQATRGAKRTK